MNRFLIEDAAPTGVAPRVRGGAALVGSAVLHGVVVLAAVALAQGSDEGTVQSDGERAGEPAVELMYVPPAPPAPPRTAPRQERRPVERASRPAAPPMPESPEHDEPAGTPLAVAELERPAPDPAALAPPIEAPEPTRRSGAASRAELMTSEAQRIFGRQGRSGAPRGGPTAAPGFEVYLPPQSDACTPARPRAPGEPIELATVSGTVYRQGTRIPLPGAHLQMIGTPYVTFSNDAGGYDLRFDPSLVDRCRTQYVRVTAPGFRAQTLVLYLGPSASNDIPMSQR